MSLPELYANTSTAWPERCLLFIVWFFPSATSCFLPLYRRSPSAIPKSTAGMLKGAADDLQNPGQRQHLSGYFSLLMPLNSLISFHPSDTVFDKPGNFVADFIRAHKSD
jgi:hypothetical protein